MDTKQRDLIKMFAFLESKHSGCDDTNADLAKGWNIHESQISRYASGEKEIPLWRIVWAIERYAINPNKIFTMLREIYTPKVLESCYNNKAFSADLVTL